MPSVISGAGLEGFLGSSEDGGCCVWMLELQLWSRGEEEQEEGEAAALPVAFLSFRTLNTAGLSLAFCPALCFFKVFPPFLGVNVASMLGSCRKLFEKLLH